MPGIVGLITKKSREWAQPQLQRMVETLKHESFYETGTWIDESLGVYLGWVARKGSFSSGLPWYNDKEDVIVGFSGEEFSGPGAASQKCSCSARESSYIVRSYEQDASFPAGLNGTFHGLVADRKSGKVLLFNDRYGMHRLYYHEAREAFYFSAEAKAILAVKPELRSVVPQSLGEFVALGCVLENRSLFTGVKLLPQGSSWKFHDGHIVQKGFYFQPSEWEDQEHLDADSYYEEVKKVFSQTLPSYFDGPEQIAMSLTGGLDTRMIMAWRKPSARSFPCYTFGGMFRDCQDVMVARQVASLRRQSHEVIATGDPFLAQFSHYAERSVYLADGCVGVNRSPDLYLQERAREIAPVRIAGTYGSEVLRGVRAFSPWDPSPGLYRPELLSRMQAAKKRYAGLLRGHPVSFAVFQHAPQRGVVALEETQLAVRTPYLDNNLVRTVFRAPEWAVAHNDAQAKHDICLRLINDGDKALGAIRTDLGLAGRSGSFSGAVARRLLDFTFKAEYAYDLGMPQWLAVMDHFASPLHLERLFLGRHKFSHFRVWYRDKLAAYVREMLLDQRTLSRPYLERKAVESMVQAHLKGSRNYTSEIHSLLTLELVHRLFVDAN
jgi:asparagine synthase (glutamine-hydrolysing)